VQHFADQLVQAFRFALDPIMLAREVGAFAARQTQRETQARQRRAKFVRHIAQ